MSKFSDRVQDFKLHATKNKYQIMVINNYFSTGNMVIIKSEDSQIVKSFDGVITPEHLNEELFRHNIDKDECDIVVVSRDWRKQIKAEEF